MRRIPWTSDPISLVPLPDVATYETMHLGRRQVPEIDGSKGAFIGLVVALSVLIVVCCAAVFYLLRHHEPTEQDRAARRERYRRTREQTLASSLGGTGPSTSTLVGSLGDKVRQLWQSTARSAGGGTGRPGRGRFGRGGRGGWIRAGSDDEWAIHSDQDDHDGGADPELGGALRSLPILKGAQARGDGTMESGDGAGDGVRIVESPLSDTGGGIIHQPYAYPYVDPFTKTTSHEALQRSQSPLSSPPSSPREGISAEDSLSHEAYSRTHSSGGGDQRHRSTMSNASVWTHGGSKFVEDI